MTSKIRETLEVLKRNGVPVGPGDSKSSCTLVTLSLLHLPNHTNGFDFNEDLRVISHVLKEQYPEFGFDIAKFNDIIAKEHREEELFAVLEKAAVRREEEL